MKEELIEFLQQFVTSERFDTILQVSQNRTNYFTVVLEDIFQSQNASAVLRTCECMGIQNVNIIENQYPFTLNRDVVLGSDKWLTIRKFYGKENNTLTAINQLKSEGYRIVATTPHSNDVTLDEFDISKGKAAFFLGTELNGLTDTMLKNADEYLRIPMYGFTESLNISVSAATILHHLMFKIHQSNVDWQLSTDELNLLRIKWLKISIKKSHLLIKEFFKRKGIPPQFL